MKPFLCFFFLVCLYQCITFSDHAWLSLDVLTMSLLRQISDGNVTHFVHCKELGLVAFIDVNGNPHYYEFDGLG